MSFTKYKDLITFKTIDEIDEEIFVLQKELFNLRLKKARKQTISSHLFIHSRRRISQLKLKKASLFKITQKK